MPTVYVEGLGDVEIAGSAPTEAERQDMLARLDDLKNQQQQSGRGRLTDSLLQVVGGVRDAAQNILNLGINRTAAAAYENPALNYGYGTSEQMREALLDPANKPFQPMMLPAVPAADTTTGGVVRGISQFMVPYMAALKIIGIGKGALSTFARAEGAAVLTEQLVFDPFDARLSDLVEQFPTLSNPVTRYLDSDPDDTEAEARLKLAMESTGLGVISSSFVGMLRGYRSMKAGRTEQGIQELEEARKAMPDIVEAPPPQSFLDADGRALDMAANVNLSRINDTEDIHNVLAVTAETFAGRIDDARRGVISDEQLRALAEDSGVTVDELLSRNQGTAWNAERILAARQLMVTSANRLHAAAKKASETGIDADLLEYKDALNIHLGLQEQVSGLAAEAGRALRQFQLMAGSDPARLLDLAGGRQTLREQATLIAQLDDVGHISRLGREFDKPTLTDKALELWINGLLSGPQTHAVNALSNTLTSLWSIPEHYMAATIGAVRRNSDRETYGEATSRMFGFYQGARDGFRAAARTFLTEQPSDVFSKLEVPRQQAIGGLVGQVFRAPGRALMTADEFFKSIGYRMELNAQAYRSALNEGLDPGSREFAQHMQGIISNPPESMSLAAIDNARYLTFTSPLEGAIGKNMQAIARELPAARVVMPFIRTPVNIVNFARERTPFGLLMGDWQRQIQAGGATADMAMAKITLGTMAGVSIVGMAGEGKITGSGPSDPVARSILRETGWQPYSFVIDQPDGTKRYVAYNRVEPLGIIFGLAADYNQIAGQIEDGDADKLAAMISAAISQNLTDKTFFKGVSDLIAAADDPDRYFDTYLRNLGGSVVPSLAAQTARVMDPMLRDTQTLLQRIQSRVPGYSDDVPARLNIWGDPIVMTGGLGPDMLSPLYSSFSRYDAATNELIRLDIAPRLPQRTIYGEEIPQEEYWTFVRNAGKLAHRQIEQLVQSEGWQNMTSNPVTREIALAEQRDIIRTIISQNRDVARAVLKIRLGYAPTEQDQRLLEAFGLELSAIQNEQAQRTEEGQQPIAQDAASRRTQQGGENMARMGNRLSQIRDSVEQIRSQ